MDRGSGSHASPSIMTHLRGHNSFSIVERRFPSSAEPLDDRSNVPRRRATNSASSISTLTARSPTIGQQTATAFVPWPRKIDDSDTVRRRSPLADFGRARPVVLRIIEQSFEPRCIPTYRRFRRCRRTRPRVAPPVVPVKGYTDSIVTIGRGERFVSSTVAASSGRQTGVEKRQRWMQ